MISFKVRTYCISMHTHTETITHNEQEYGVGAMYAFEFKNTYTKVSICVHFGATIRRKPRERGRERQRMSECE